MLVATVAPLGDGRCLSMNPVLANPPLLQRRPPIRLSLDSLGHDWIPQDTWNVSLTMLDGDYAV